MGRASDGLLVRVACHSWGRLAAWPGDSRLPLTNSELPFLSEPSDRSLSLCSSTWPARTLMVAVASNTRLPGQCAAPGRSLATGPKPGVHGLEQGATAAARGVQLM